MDVLILLLLALTCFPAIAWGHARLMNPPSRSSMWRSGFPTKKNFNDNALYCGGITIQWQQNGGKCGICGDPYNMPHPRDNEAGGKYGRGIISKRYLAGQVIEATVDVTTNHRGYFEFKLCPNNNPKKEATQDCLDKHILKEAHGTGVRYYIGDKSRGNITVKLQLPKSLTCSQCVFQWTYVAGNNWGRCADGKSRLGCGPQETFRGCADIAIEKNSGKDFNVKFNENDVENKYDSEHSHKNWKHGYTKGWTEAKHTEQDASKHGHKNTTETEITENHNHHHHYDHKSHKNGDYLPTASQKPGNSRSKKPFFNDHPNHRFVNRRKYHKFDNRHFYHINRPTSRHYPTGKVIKLDNNWTTNLRRASPFHNYHQYVSKKHNAETSRGYLQSHDSPKRFMDLYEAESLSHGFNLGGRRYNDFWHL